MPPVAAVPKPGGAGQQMPKWAWPVAAGGGLLIGFFLLRKTPPEVVQEGGEDEAQYPQEQKRGGGGGGGAMPFLDEGAIEAFGLTPPTNDFSGAGTGEGNSSEGGEAAAVTSDGTITSLAQQARNAVFSFPTTSHAQQVQSYFSQPTSTQPAWQGQPVTGISSPAPAPAPAPTGGGSSQHKAQ